MHRSLLLVPLLALAACATAQKAPTETAAPARVEAPAPAPVVAEPAPAVDPFADLVPVHFAYDSSELSAESKANLDRAADLLRRQATVTVTIEGHTDERGTEEYNLALGERRASAVRKYLRNSGVDDGRLRTVSFGENRPASRGAGESAHAQNRRAEFAVR